LKGEKNRKEESLRRCFFYVVVVAAAVECCSSPGGIAFIFVFVLFLLCWLPGLSQDSFV
jgi:hypothetical protein